jgi:hypothetical protein
LITRVTFPKLSNSRPIPSKNAPHDGKPHHPTG